MHLKMLLYPKVFQNGLQLVFKIIYIFLIILFIIFKNLKGGWRLGYFVFPESLLEVK